jgi:hypothetical protein
MLEKGGLIEKSEKYDGIEEVVGELLTKGKIVARFNGRVNGGQELWAIEAF